MFFEMRGAFVVLAAAIASLDASASGCAASQTQSQPLSSSQSLTLDMAINQVRNASPRVRLQALESRALGAEADQASRRLNPVLSLEVENFAGGGTREGFREADTTLAVEQTFRLGNKRTLSERARRAQAALATAECAVIQREVELQAAILFAELSAALEMNALAEESAELATTVSDTVAKRVEAGAAAPPELSRAMTDRALSKTGLYEAEAQIAEKRYALASLWGSSEPEFSNPVLMVISDVDTPSETTHPRLAASRAALDMRQAQTRLDETAAIPDITVSAGIRRFEATDDQALVAGVSVPLPLFDRGQDQARATAFRAEAAALDRKAIEQELLADQRSAVAALKAAEAQLSLLVDEALPEAESAYDSSLRGYEVGRFDLTSVLNARAALIRVRSTVIEARLNRNIQDLKLRSLISAAPFTGVTQ